MKMGSAKVGSMDRLIGTILVDVGRLTPEDVDHILERQQQVGLLFGEVALQLGLLSQADVQYALSLQFDYPFLPPGTLRPVADEVFAAYRPFSPEGERLRMLHSQLQLRWGVGGAKRTALTIVSASRSEGRSHLAANLAVVFAQAGERTLLIDADLRAPRQHKLFKLESIPRGLSTMLAGRAHEQMVNFVPGIPGLGVLAAGPVPPNPVELLSRPMFDRILEQSMSTFDVVIIDTPPLESGPDASIVGRLAGACLAVARTNLTRSKAFAALNEDMAAAGVRMVGSVLVDVPLEGKPGAMNPSPAV